MVEPMEPPGRDLRCRQIKAADLPAIVDLLARGFPIRRPDFWVRALDRLTGRPLPADLAPYGYLLEAGGSPRGVILTIFSGFEDAQHPVRCNLSSWYVDPAYRPYAGPLISAATRRKGVTYVNISPAPHTRPVIEAQGFRLYSVGQSVILPHASRGPRGVKIEVIGPGFVRPGLDGSEGVLLADHAGFGCVSLVCVASNGAFPFVFAPRRIRRVLPVAHLLYARDRDSFVRFAAPLSRFLLRRGLPAITVGGSALAGVPGRFFPHVGPRYYKGPSPPPLLDLSYTEIGLFGA